MHCTALMMMQTIFVQNSKECESQILFYRLLQNLRAACQNTQKENKQSSAKEVVFQKMNAGIVKGGRLFNEKKPQSGKRRAVEINVYHELKKHQNNNQLEFFHVCPSIHTLLSQSIAGFTCDSLSDNFRPKWLARTFVINVLQWLVASRQSESNTLQSKNQYSDLQVTKITWHFIRNKKSCRPHDRTGSEQSQGAKASICFVITNKRQFIK